MKLFTIGLLCLLIAVKVNCISISQIGDVRIEVTDSVWRCDRIECPDDTHRCFVSKEKDPNDATILVRTNICYSKNKQPLAQSVTTSKINANTKIRTQINSYRSGVISSINSYTSNGSSKEDKALKEDLKRMREDIESQVSNIKSNVQKEMKTLKKNLNHMNSDLNQMGQNIRKDVNRRVNRFSDDNDF